MDYIPGKDLRALMIEARRNKTFLLEKDVLSWADQLASALAFLHMQIRLLFIAISSQAI